MGVGRWALPLESGDWRDEIRVRVSGFARLPLPAGDCRGAEVLEEIRRE